MSFTEQLEKAFAEREHLAEDILINKQAVIDYDRQRNANREALNQLKKKSNQEEKIWVNFGGMFMKLPVANTKKLIEKDQKKLDEKTEESRRIMKEKTRELEILEGKSNRMLGFDLKGMSASELYNIR